MQENSNEAPNPRLVKKPLILLGIVVIIVGIASTYFHITKVRSLNKIVAEEKAKKAVVAPATPSVKDEGVFTYKSKVSPLKLTLPKSMTLIVNHDGNKGGAPGFTFRIGKSTDNPNIIIDSGYSWIRLESTSSLGGLTATANYSKTRMEEASYGYDGLVISDRTVKGIPAKQIEGKGLGYAGTRRTVVFVREDYGYEITANGENTFDDLEIVLNGISFE